MASAAVTQGARFGHADRVSSRVVVVGAGPTGLTVAALLAQHGVRSVVVERRAEPYPLPRAVHLDDEAMRVLERVGIMPAFLPLTRSARGLRLLDAEHRTMAEFPRGEGVHGYPQANLFDQPDLERLLRQHVAQLPEVELRLGAEVVALSRQGAGARVRLSGGEELDASYVLGCDGAGSTVRRLSGIALRELRFEERWLVVDVRCPDDLETWDGVHQVCDPARAATYMQIGADRYRWEFRLLDGEAPSDVSLPELLGRWTQHDLEIVRSAEYVFRARVARRWRAGNVVLLGDAAHQTPPFIGQGLGSGLRDAENLAWKLAWVLEGKAGDWLLDTYEDERAPHVTSLVRKAITAGWAMTGGQGSAARVRRLALAGVCRVPGGTGLLDRETPALRGGWLLARGRLIGTLLPRLGRLQGNGFTVLSDGPVPSELGVPGSTVLTSAASRAWLRQHGLRAALVRPDGVVMATAGRRRGVPAGQRDAVVALFGSAEGVT